MSTPPTRPHPKAIGDASAAMVMARLVQAGKKLWVPFGENNRADVVMEEEDGSFVRVQCKTGRLRTGAVRFPTCSFTYHHPNNRGTRPYMHDYRGQIDIFGVYCPETDGVYLVPLTAVGIRVGALRVQPTRNNQRKKISWAQDFELRPG